MQCGSILPSSVRTCHFCDIPAENPVNGATASPLIANQQASQQYSDHRREVSERLAAYRVRRRKLASHEDQSQFSFDDRTEPPSEAHIAVAEAPLPTEPPAEEFAFTIAIGRCVESRDRDGQMMIDVSSPVTPPETDAANDPSCDTGGASEEGPGLYPVAPIEERRLAAFADALCLLFAYGGFLALFASLGGQFTASKLNAAIYVATFAFVYVQYFALFTVFGGTTPGMMFRGLQVVNFSGEPPTPRQLLLRACGYMLSAGSLFMGFAWAIWDEDALAWHDRLSHTYLTSPQTLAESEAHSFASSH
jgi:uncharacterized RDD family membrane protein YckC